VVIFYFKFEINNFFEYLVSYINKIFCYSIYYTNKKFVFESLLSKPWNLKFLLHIWIQQFKILLNIKLQRNRNARNNFLFFKRWYVSNKWEKCHTRSWLDFKCPIIFPYSLDTNIQFILNCAIVCRTCNTILNWTNKFTNQILIVSLINSVNNLLRKILLQPVFELGLLPLGRASLITRGMW